MGLEYNITYRDKDKGIQAIISYKDNGKWKQKSKQGFENSRKGKTEAKNWVKNTLNDLENNISNEIVKGMENLTIGELKKDFLRHIELHREYNTWSNYKYALNDFDIDKIEIKNLKIADIQKCVDKFVNKFAKKTINNRIVVFRAMLSYANRQYNIVTPNLSNLTIPTSKTRAGKIALEPLEQKELLYNFKTRSKDYYVVILLALTCGLRVGEICGLTWGDVDFKESKLNIDKQWKRDRVTKLFVFGSLKSKESYRTVPIPKSTLDELKLIKYARFGNALTISYKQERIIYSINTQSICSNLDGKLKKKHNVSIHELRHTYATNLIASGMDFKTAAKLLGHNVEQTMKTYSHVTQSMLDQAAELINKIF